MSESSDLDNVVASLEKVVSQRDEGQLVHQESTDGQKVNNQDAERPRASGMDVVMNMSVEIEIVLGSTSMPISKLMKLSRGSIVPLDRRVGEPVDVVVNNRIVARGEVVILDEENSQFGVCLTELVGGSENHQSG